MPLPPEWNVASRDRLTRTHERFFDGDTLFDRVGRTLCVAASLPRKEFHESFEVARRVHRRLKGRRVIDLCAGHGLTGMLLSIMDRDAPAPVLCDRKVTGSHAPVLAAMSAQWPKLAATTFVVGDLRDAPVQAGDLVVSVHACGGLTDQVLDRAIAVGADVAVLPCCHAEKKQDDGGLDAWMPNDLAIDAVRALRLRAAGYETHLTTIPLAVTPKNRLVMGWKHQ